MCHLCAPTIRGGRVFCSLTHLKGCHDPVCDRAIDSIERGRPHELGAYRGPHCPHSARPPGHGSKVASRGRRRSGARCFTAQGPLCADDEAVHRRASAPCNQFEERPSCPVTDRELLAGFDQNVEDDPDARIWMAPRDRHSADSRPEYLPDTDPCAEGVTTWEILTDDEGEYVESDPESPLVSGGHMGEMWLGEGDYVYMGGRKTRKPLPTDIAEVCHTCAESWPLPIKRSWSSCEFGGPRQWCSVHPEMEVVIDDDPLIYRVAPWIWTFCHCNGCLEYRRGKGRPPKYCGPKCEAAADNARDRAKRLANGVKPRDRQILPKNLSRYQKVA